MNEDQLIRIISEVRSEFQIPPYFSDEGLKNYAREGEVHLLSLNPGRDVDKNLKYRMLLKNYVYYAYHHVLNEFSQNYASDILGWQLNGEVEE